MNDLNQNIKDQPVSVGDWVITYLITLIPLVGFVMLFVWAFGNNTKISKANWAKAALLLFAISLVLGILVSIVFGVGIWSFFNDRHAGNF
jgi:isoprenylcysteine carboxyl methyltransferase (ICMT) family protein YpbQ